MEARDLLITLDILCKHDWEEMHNKILNKDIEILKNDNVKLIVESELYALFNKGYGVVTIVDEEYPKEILSSIKPPFVIYYKGPLETLRERYSYRSPIIKPDRIFVD